MKWIPDEDMELVVASKNLESVREIREILKELAPSLFVRSLFDFPHFQRAASSPSLTEQSTEGHARDEAVTASRALERVVLAMREALIVPALGKAPCEQTVRDLIVAMQGLHDLERAAYIICCFAISPPNGAAYTASCRVEGCIAEESGDTNGADFEAVFVKHDYRLPLARLSASVRSRISPRRKTLEKLLPTLLSFYTADA